MFSLFFNSSLNFILGLPRYLVISFRCLTQCVYGYRFLKIVHWGFVVLAVFLEQLLVLCDAFTRFFWDFLVIRRDYCYFCSETFTVHIRSSFLRVARRSIFIDLMLFWWVLRISLWTLLGGLFDISLHSSNRSFSWFNIVLVLLSVLLLLFKCVLVRLDELKSLLSKLIQTWSLNNWEISLNVRWFSSVTAKKCLYIILLFLKSGHVQLQ